MCAVDVQIFLAGICRTTDLLAQYRRLMKCRRCDTCTCFDERDGRATCEVVAVHSAFSQEFAHQPSEWHNTSTRSSAAVAIVVRVVFCSVGDRQPSGLCICYVFWCRDPHGNQLSGTIPALDQVPVLLYLYVLVSRDWTYFSDFQVSVTQSTDWHNTNA